MGIFALLLLGGMFFTLAERAPPGIIGTLFSCVFVLEAALAAMGDDGDDKEEGGSGSGSGAKVGKGGAPAAACKDASPPRDRSASLDKVPLGTSLDG